MSIQALMETIHGDNRGQFEPTEHPNVFKTGNALSPYFYRDGYFYREMDPIMCWAMGVSYTDQDFSDMIGDRTKEQYLEIVLSMKKNFDEMVEKDDFVGLYSIIDKKIGLSTFKYDFNNRIIPSDQIYDAFVEIYQRSEFGFEVLTDIYSEVFLYAPYSEERNKRIKSLKKRGKEITIYHGELPNGPMDHYSWTLDKGVAKWFANRYDNLGEIWTATIPVGKAIDYLTSRNEEEVLVDFNELKDYSIEDAI